MYFLYFFSGLPFFFKLSLLKAGGKWSWVLLSKRSSESWLSKESKFSLCFKYRILQMPIFFAHFTLQIHPSDYLPHVLLLSQGYAFLFYVCKYIHANWKTSPVRCYLHFSFCFPLVSFFNGGGVGGIGDFYWFSFACSGLVKEPVLKLGWEIKFEFNKSMWL